jgi:pyruvate dehydrogenase E2 component (dihydrolipoamide acetyltransferase)
MQAKPFGVDLPPWPSLDFSAFGEVEKRPLPKLQKFVAGFMSRNWVNIPHVTHHDEADITDLDEVRKSLGEAHPGNRITPLAFFIKALVGAMQEYPQFNASLDLSNGALIFKKYFNVGVAVDTPNGLLVPVLRNCDQKTIPELSREIAELSEKARSKGLPMNDMVGGCITISSLGGIGGTAFTPIINAPEVAILGVTKAQWKATRGAGDEVVWRKVLPLDLSYDHRAINGADAARFTATVAQLLASPQRLIV